MWPHAQGGDLDAIPNQPRRCTRFGLHHGAWTGKWQRLTLAADRKRATSDRRTCRDLNGHV